MRFFAKMAELHFAFVISCFNSSSLFKRFVKLVVILGTKLAFFSTCSASGYPKRFNIFRFSWSDGGKDWSLLGSTLEAPPPARMQAVQASHKERLWDCGQTAINGVRVSTRNR